MAPPRYHVLQFDFRGHGASDPAGTTLGTAERQDVAAAVRLLQGRGLGPIALYGISMGGATAVLAAPTFLSPRWWPMRRTPTSAIPSRTGCASSGCRCPASAHG